MTPHLLKVFLPALLAFLIGIAITPHLTRFMYKARLWKRVKRSENNPDAISVKFEEVHNADDEVRTPRVGGTIIWISVLVTTLILFILAHIIDSPLASELDYVSRNQTLLPFVALIFGSLFGLFEDVLEIFPDYFSKFRHGLDDKYLIILVGLFGLFYGWWFYAKLGIESVVIPIVGYTLHLGWFFIIYFIVLVLGTFSSRVIDGIDGLAGGVLSIIYTAFAIIGLIHGQYDIAAFCFVVAAGLLVFLWFNVPPARFYMGETGMMGLVLCLPVVATLLGVSLWIVIIGFPLVATAFSSFAQILSKKYLGKKIFRIAPLHHHFQAIGWSSPKVVMRYWIFTLVCAMVGVIAALIA